MHTALERHSASPETVRWRFLAIRTWKYVIWQIYLGHRGQDGVAKSTLGVLDPRHVAAPRSATGPGAPHPGW